MQPIGFVFQLSYSDRLAASGYHAANDYSRFSPPRRTRQSQKLFTLFAVPFPHPARTPCASTRNRARCSTPRRAAGSTIFTLRYHSLESRISPTTWTCRMTDLTAATSAGNPPGELKQALWKCLAFICTLNDTDLSSKLFQIGVFLTFSSPSSVRIVRKCGIEVLQCVPDNNDIYQLRVNLERDLAWDRGKVSCFVVE